MDYFHGPIDKIKKFYYLYTVIHSNSNKMNTLEAPRQMTLKVRPLSASRMHTLRSEYDKMVAKIEAEEARRADLRPASMVVLLQEYKEHRDKLLAWIEAGEMPQYDYD